LIDSPGVTEDEGDSVARQITEQCQRDLACGFIYVLDGMRSAEEAAQVINAGGGGEEGKLGSGGKRRSCHLE
jgi:hypothetical protein